MKDSNLVKISLLWSILGIVFLLIISRYSTPNQVDIGSLENKLGKTVVVQGKVSEFTSTPEVTFMTLQDETGKVKVVSFKRVPDIENKARAEITGKVELYKGELEIIAEKIKCYG